MGIKLNRNKKKNLLLSIIYRICKLPFASDKTKFNLFLNLEWIFDRLAHEKSFQIYKASNHPLRLFTKEFILNFIQPDHNVLDVGCKYGDITFDVAEKVKKVVGIDLDKNAIEKARTKFQRNNLSFEVGDALSYLNNNTEKFDVLILSHLLEHIENPEKFINEYKKHVRFIYIELPDFDKTYLNHYRKEMACDLIYTDPDHIVEFDRKELKELIEKCNLEIVRTEFRFGIQKVWCKVI